MCIQIRNTGENFRVILLQKRKLFAKTISGTIIFRENFANPKIFAKTYAKAKMFAKRNFESERIFAFAKMKKEVFVSTLIIMLPRVGSEQFKFEWKSNKLF
jgi:hypothetical protein